MSGNKSDSENLVEINQTCGGNKSDCSGNKSDMWWK